MLVIETHSKNLYSIELRRLIAQFGAGFLTESIDSDVLALIPWGRRTLRSQRVIATPPLAHTIITHKMNIKKWNFGREKSRTKRMKV